MDAGLKIKIGAETVEVTKSLERLKDQLKSFETALEKATDAKRVDLLNRSIERTKAIIAGVKGFKIDNDLPKLTQDTKQASFALTNLGRVAQDAPFGFIGIQNNIEPLIQSFGQLKANTGSTKEAFKALGASLLGPSGVLVGFSVLTSLVTVAIQKYGSFSNAVSALTGDLSTAEKAQRAVSAALTESGAKAQSEIDYINSLISVAKDKALSDQARQQAINKLNKDYDSYLPNLTLETVYTDKTTEAVKKLNAELLRQAQIQGARNYITKIYEDIAKATVDAANAGNDLLRLSSGKLFTDPFGTIKFGIQAFGVQNATSDVKDLNETLKVAQNALKSLLGQEATSGDLGGGKLKDNIEKLKQLKKELLEKQGKLKIELDPENKKVLINDIKDLQKQIANLKGENVKVDIVSDKDATKRLYELSASGYADLLKLDQQFSDDKAKKEALNFQDQLKRLEIEYTEALNKEKELLYKNAAQKQQVLDTLSKLYEQKRAIIQLEADKALFINLEDGASKAGEKAADAWVEAWKKGISPVKPPELLSRESDNIAAPKLKSPDYYKKLAELQLKISEKGIVIPLSVNKDDLDSLTDWFKNLSEQTSQVSDLLVNTLGKAFDDVFMTIIKGGGNAMQAFSKAIEQVIVQLIAAAIKAAIFAAIASAFGASTSGGAQGFGAIFNELFSKFSGISLKKNAAGGIATKSTVGIFGEAGAEALIPLERLKNMIGNSIEYGFNAASALGIANRGNEQLVAKVQGSDLAFVLSRTNNTYSRLG